MSGGWPTGSLLGLAGALWRYRHHFLRHFKPMVLPPSLAFAACRSAAKVATARAFTTTTSRLMSSSKPYAVNAVFTIKEDRRDEFISIIQDDQKLSLKVEEGIVRFVVGEDKDKKNTFYLHEEYVNEDAFKKHTEMPHFKPWDDFTKTDPWTEDGAPVADFYVCTHEAGKKEAMRSGHALNAKFTIKADRRDEFLKIMKEDQEETLAKEKGSIQFVIGGDKDKKNTFYLFEQYVNEEAFNEHNEMPHFQPWKAFTETDPFTEDGAPVAGFYNTLKAADEKEAEKEATETCKRDEPAEPAAEDEPAEKKQKAEE